MLHLSEVGSVDIHTSSTYIPIFADSPLSCLLTVKFCHLHYLARSFLFSWGYLISHDMFGLMQYTAPSGFNQTPKLPFLRLY